MNIIFLHKFCMEMNCFLGWNLQNFTRPPVMTVTDGQISSLDTIVIQYDSLNIHTLNPEIIILYQFHNQTALFKVPKICNINFWIENEPSPLWNFSKNSLELVVPPFPQWDKMRFEYQRVQFQWKKRVKIFTKLLTVRAEGADPYSQPDCKISVFYASP